MASVKRLVCIVEGDGEVEALPVLCNRIARELLSVRHWYVDEQPIRLPRSRIVDQSAESPRRSANMHEMKRVLGLAATRRPDAILVCCDADDDCPAAWSQSMPTEARVRQIKLPVASVMACREFESWLLWGVGVKERRRVRAQHPDRTPRDAKKALRELFGSYKPTLDQKRLTRQIHLPSAWAGSDSFAKLVRSIGGL